MFLAKCLFFFFVGGGAYHVGRCFHHMFLVLFFFGRGRDDVGVDVLEFFLILEVCLLK